MDLCKDSRVPPELAAKYEAEAGNFWDLFYRRNLTRFFKDRHWFAREFPQLLGARTVLEVGCGVGNTVYPLLEINPQAFVYACDFAPTAVDLVLAHPQFAASGRVAAFVADITGDDLTANVPPASVDVCMMIFVLSAISPEAMPCALRQVAATLRPGGQVLFRDYAAGDLAQDRLAAEGRQQLLGASFYVRWDGTRAFYFSEAGLRELFEAEGFTCEGVSLKEKEVENRKKGARMDRRFLQAVFTYTGSSGGGVERQAAADAGPLTQQRQQGEKQQQLLEEELQLSLGSAALQLSCRRPQPEGALEARAAAAALAALVLRCPAFFQGTHVLELCSWDAPLAALAALRWCRRAVAAGGSEAAVGLLRRNARRNSHLFVVERLRLQQLSWWHAEEEVDEQAAQQRQQQQQLGQLQRAFPAGFQAVLAAAGSASEVQQLLGAAAALLSRQPDALAILCLTGHDADRQIAAAAANVGLRQAPLPPELATAAAAGAGEAPPPMPAGTLQFICMQHAGV